MTGDPRVFALLEEMLESGRSAEEVCVDHPELLSKVRQQWKAFCRIDAEFEALLPSSYGSTAVVSRSTELPQVPGYRIDSELGHGGMGIVYRAWHLRLDRPVALKMLLAGAQARPAELERFLREAEVVAALHHPHIVQVHDAGEVDGSPYFTMELVEGGTLAEQIQGIPQPARRSVALVAILADAIHLAHQYGIVHRDLKPGNILLTLDGTPKVSDFGLARRLEGNWQLTNIGVPMGTPSYMSPEQARADTGSIGPATDVYSLGAILYELLTGRPPFRSDTPSATLHQVANEEPVPLRRLNPRVPRDLQTICLKCLNKEPHRRYASAQALAEDLRRFERGEPIQARPVGLLEHAAGWVRRRPALAGALTLGVLLASALVVTVVRWQGQRAALTSAAVAYAEADLRESERLRDSGEFSTSAEVLRRAKDRLDKFVPPELRERLSTAFANLELVTRLDAIRLERSLMQSGASLEEALVVSAQGAPQDPQLIPNEVVPARHYQAEFERARLGTLQDDPAKSGALVLASPVSAALVAALDDWAACETNRDQQTWVLAVARHADPDPWRDRFRDPHTWDDPGSLRQLADEAPVAKPSPQLLAQLGARMRAKGIDAESFLTRVVASYPNDFWANVEAGNALLRSKPHEAIGYYRTAVALRPETVALHHALGILYFERKLWNECLAHHQHAVRLMPDSSWSRTGLGAALAELGRTDEAMIEYRKAIRLDANNAWPHHNLAVLLERQGLFDEAIAEYRLATPLFSTYFARIEKQKLRILLSELGRHAEARQLWKEHLAEKPSEHDDWFGYAELCLYLEDEAEYRRARSELLSQFGSATDQTIAERTGRACLLLPAPESELRQAVELTERAVAAGRPGDEVAYPYRLFALALARYRQARFDEATNLLTGEAACIMGPSPGLVLAMTQYQQGQKEDARRTLAAAISAWDWSASNAKHNGVWIAHVLRREAETLISPVQSTSR